MTVLQSMNIKAICIVIPSYHTRAMYLTFITQILRTDKANRIPSLITHAHTNTRETWVLIWKLIIVDLEIECQQKIRHCLPSNCLAIQPNCSHHWTNHQQYKIEHKKIELKRKEKKNGTLKAAHNLLLSLPSEDIFVALRFIRRIRSTL